MTINSCPYVAKPATYITSHLVFRLPISVLAVDSIFSKLDMLETFPAKMGEEAWGHLILAAKRDWCGCYRSPLPVPEK